jgi:hypothetical protein
MDHYEIEDMFRSEQYPVLMPIWNISHFTKNGRGDDQLQLHFMLKNTGHVTAVRPYLWLVPPFEEFPFERNLRIEQNDTRGLDGKVKFQSDSRFVLFPEDFVEFCTFDLVILSGQIGNVNCYWGKNRMPNENNVRKLFDGMKITIFAGAQNCPKTEIIVELSKQLVEEKCKVASGY